MTVKIIFEAHSTTFDNEAKLSSGWNDVELSPLGIKQSHELGDRYKDEDFDAIFCSDLQRSFKTAEIAFAGRDIKIIKDARLRECNYGDFTQAPSEQVEEQKVKRITTKFPNGENYMDTRERMLDFLEYLKSNFNGKKVMIIGHRATQYGLENIINNMPYETLVTTKFKWQPGWLYEL